MNFQFSFFNFQKKTTAFLVFSLLFVYFTGQNTAQASGLVKAPNNFGMVGYWSMEDGKGTKATDFSGKGNIGTLTNMDAATDWVTGKIGKALDFDGTNDYVKTGSNLGITGSANLTIAFWVKPTNVASGGMAAGLVDSSPNIAVFVGPLGATGGSGSVSVEYQSCGEYTANGVVSSGVWQHIAVVKTSGTVHSNTTIYVNGVAQSHTNEYSDCDPSFGGSNSFNMGSGWNSDADFPFAGSVDEVRVYNRALSATEVAALYAKTSQALIKNSSRGLIAHWTFEEGTGTATADKTGNGNTGTLTNGPTWDSGKFGKGITFDGSNDHVTTTFVNGKVFTWSAWFKARSFASYQNIMDIGSPNYMLVLTNSNNLTFWSADGMSGNALGTPTLSAGSWYHVVLVREGDSITNGYKAYLNGAYTGAANTGTWSSSDYFTIGGRVDGSGQYFPGTIDDVRIYNRALSAQEVSNLYNSSGEALGILNRAHRDTLTSGLVGYWSFDGPTMTTATSSDSSGQGNHGTLTGGPTKTIGVLGQALKFDGTDDRIVVGSPTGLGYGTGDFSWFAWINPERLNDSYEMIWAQGSGGIPYLAVRDSTLHFYLSGTYETSASYIIANTWQHVGVIRSGGVMTLYKDGVAYGSTSTQSGSISSPDFGYVSSYGSGGAHAFKGNIDEVRVYNRALSASEVLQLYAQGK